MPRAPAEIAVAILAKAPVPGLAKTRLIPTLGADGAAALAAGLIRRTVATAVAAATGPVTLWAAPDTGHPLFAELARAHPLTLAHQPDGDLGARMLACCAGGRPTLVIGIECPAFTPRHLVDAANVLREGIDAVLVPAEDGGYVLIGTRAPQPALFDGLAWSTPTVMSETRRRLRRLGLSWREPAQLWDVDTAKDLARFRAGG